MQDLTVEVERLSAAVAGLEQDKVQHANLLGKLSGLVVDLERERTAQASEAVRLHEVIVQLERDKEALERDKEIQATETARLSNVIAEARRQHIKHELPQLGGDPSTPIACRTDDPIGLLQIVESQASQLVRLRRALLSAQTIAAQRLELIGNGENASAAEWVRSIIVDEIYQIRDSIGEIVEQSRWRRIGQRLGLAKRLDWERNNWRTAPVDAAGELVLDERIVTLPISKLLSELERLHELLTHLKSSRWRKLGQWLGLAKRLPWETGAKREPLLSRRFPEEEVWHRANLLSERGSAQSGYAEGPEDIIQRFHKECRSSATDVILDIGANTGQFAQGLRAAGYNGHLISFEPLSDAHATLVAAAALDPLWDVADRCALGSSDGWGQIDISGDSYSSSLLAMHDLHREAVPESVHKGTERCRVICLDSFIEQTVSDSTTLIGLKIDTQGYEAQVLAGLRRNRDRVKVLLCKMSLFPSYYGSPGISELCRLLAEFGFRCVALCPAFEHKKTGELLQVDGIFVKRD